MTDPPEQLNADICLTGMGGRVGIEHDLRPYVQIRDGHILIEYFTTAQPLYPFQCRRCRALRELHADEAVERGLIIPMELR